MDPLDAVSAALIVLGILNVIATLVLLDGARRHRWPALVERALMAVLLTVAGASIAVLAFARLDHLAIDRGVATVFLIVPFIMLSIPNIVWLVAYMLGKFDE